MSLNKTPKIRVKGKKKKDLWIMVFERDRFKCQKCNGPGSHAHHIIWLSRGGSDTLANLITLCAECHAFVHRKNIEILFGDNGWVFIEPKTKIIKREE